MGGRGILNFIYLNIILLEKIQNITSEIDRYGFFSEIHFFEFTSVLPAAAFGSDFDFVHFRNFRFPVDFRFAKITKNEIFSVSVQTWEGFIELGRSEV